jgi:hypothetical protein
VIERWRACIFKCMRMCVWEERACLTMKARWRDVRRFRDYSKDATGTCSGELKFCAGRTRKLNRTTLSVHSCRSSTSVGVGGGGMMMVLVVLVVALVAAVKKVHMTFRL